MSGRFGFWIGGGCGGMSSVSSPPPRLVSDDLWALVEPLIPPGRPAVHGRTGRPRRSDREVLEGARVAPGLRDPQLRTGT